MMLRALAAFAACLALPCACVDTSPIDYRAVAPVPRDGGAPTDAPDDGARVAACRECVTTGACAEERALCDENARCTLFVECVVDAYCLNFSFTDLANLPPCLVACAASAGLSGQDDPAVPFMSPLLLCVQDEGRCGPACNQR